jgi:1-acyl-sn-glycerol-3-phosphate acyltransferase
MPTIRLDETDAFLRKIAAVLDRDLNGKEAELAKSLVHRLAAETGGGESVDGRDLYVAVRDFKRALDLGSYHYLNRLTSILRFEDREVVAATLIAVSRTVNLIDPFRGMTPGAFKGQVDDLATKPSYWQMFLDKLISPPEHLFWFGAREMMTGAERAWDLMWTSSTLLMAPGENVDMRLSELIRRAVDLAAALPLPESEAAEVSELRRIAGDGVRASGDEAALAKRYASDPEFGGAVEKLFGFLARRGDSETARQAGEVLLFLSRTDLYAQRAANPVGLPTAKFPRTDGADRDQVFALLKHLGIKFETESDRANVWRIWEASWNNSAVGADDLLVDLDKTQYDWSVSLKRLGRENIELREIVVALAAKALRDKKPIPFATHSAATRVEEIVNHPDFAIMKFTLFLRTPSDPTVSLEEILTMPNGLTHDTLAQGEITTLRRFHDNGLDFAALSERDKHVVAMAMTDVEKYFTEFWRGHKFPEMLTHDDRERPRTHVDDSPGNLEVTAGSGMPGILAPKRLRAAEDPADVSSSYALNVLDAIDGLRGTFPGTVADVTDTRQTAPMPKAELRYEDYFVRSFRGWVRPAIDLIGIKLKIWCEIVRRGEFAKYRDAFAAVMKKEHPVVMRSDLRSPARYEPGREADEFRRRSEPGTTTRGDPRIGDLVDAATAENGGLTLNGISYDATRAASETPGTRLGYYARVPALALRALQLLKKGDEDGLNQIAALWGAEILDYLSLRLDVKGLEKLDPEKAYIFAPTHGSEVEFPLLWLALKGYNVGFIGKKSFRFIPFFGQVMASSRRFFFINRANSESARHTLSDAADVLNDPANRFSIVIYPQGTRSRSRRDKDGKRIDGDLYAGGGLKSGVAHLALDTGLEIVPITMNNVGRVLPAGRENAVTNEKVEIVIGDPISVKGLEGTREEKVDAILEGLYDSYDRHYAAPHSGKATGRAWEALRKIEKINASGTFEADEKTLTRLMAKATPVTSTLGLDGEEIKAALKEGRVNKFRLGLNSYLDRFREPWLALESGNEADFTAWCLSHDVSPEFVNRLVEFFPEDEVHGVFARAGFDLNAPDAPKGFSDERQTWEFMRTQRTGPWLIKNSLRRALERLLAAKPAETGSPDVVYHDDDSKIPPDFREYQNLWWRDNAENYVQAERLFTGQMGIQSPGFRERVLPGIFTGLETAQEANAEAMRRHVERESAIERADDGATTRAVRDLYGAVLDGGLFAGVDGNLRLFAFETLLAREEYDAALTRLPRQEDAVTAARGRFYRRWGDGTAHQILNVYDAAVKNSLTGIRQFDPHLQALSDRAGMVVAVSEAAALGVTLKHRLTDVEGEMAALAKKLGPFKIGRFNRMSATAVRYAELSRESGFLRRAAGLQNEIGAGSLDALLTHLAEGPVYSITPISSDGSWRRLMTEHPPVARAWDAFRRAESEWEDASAREAAAVLDGELRYYQASFETEIKTNREDFKLQRGRYGDLIGILRGEGRLTPTQEAKLRQALADYELKFGQYEKVAGEMTRPEAKSSEPQRKKHELETLFAWLRLQWTVADIAKQSGSRLAGKIRPFSAMFPNQTRILNSLSSEEMEGLRPIFESMTCELLSEMYKEVYLAAGDPRKLERIMAKWGLDSVRRGSGSVHVYGAKLLLRAAGQSVGVDLFKAGKSLLDEDQAERFGMVPRGYAFSANHQGFFDYPAMAFLAALGFMAGITADMDNFYAMPVLSPVMRGSYSPFTRRGVTRLIDVIPRYADRGASPVTYDHGTRRVTTVVNPLARGKYAAFVPREFIFGGSRAETAMAAAVSRIPTVALWQDFKMNVEPDLGLTGNKYRGNFKLPWSIHNGTGSLVKERATIAFGRPYASWRMPEVVSSAAFSPETGMAKLNPSQKIRRANAAHTEVGGRFGAYLSTLRMGPGPGPMIVNAMPRLR